MRDHRFVIACVAALPLCVVTIYLAAVSLTEAGGGSLLAARAPANVAEAAASGRADLVLRLLRHGERADAVYDVHPDVISSAVRRATALEAAIWSRQLELVELLDREGAIPHAERRALACLAGDLGVDDVAEYLGPVEPACVPDEAYNAVAARTAREAAPQ